MGTGYAWAWHNKPKLWLIACLNVILSAFDDNDGALYPMGSKVKETEHCKIKLNPYYWHLLRVPALHKTKPYLTAL